MLLSLILDIIHTVTRSQFMKVCVYYSVYVTRNSYVSSRGDFSNIKVDFSNIKVDFSNFKVDFSNFKVDFSNIKVDFSNIKVGKTRKKMMYKVAPGSLRSVPLVVFYLILFYSAHTAVVNHILQLTSVSF